MLTRGTFASTFARRAVFGMIHLLPLPGAPLFVSIEEVLDAALRDARAISDGGADGLVFENFGDRPFTKGRVEAETVAAMTHIVSVVTRAVRVPFGVNVLRNDARSALAIAAATGAAFIRVNVHTGATLTDQGLIEGDAYATMRERARLAPGVHVFADHLVKHATPLGDVDPVQSAKDLRLRGLADALIVSGAETGAAADPSRLTLLRDAVGDAPLLLGSGLTVENAASFAGADGAIVGTSIKRGGRLDEPVDARRVERIVKAFRG
ncbi:MAG TPA: BtpA/SgcQ family protein [Thermoanaerobaculia bacterium]